MNSVVITIILGLASCAFSVFVAHRYNMRHVAKLMEKFDKRRAERDLLRLEQRVERLENIVCKSASLR